jgi:hypothetical protein
MASYQGQCLCGAARFSVEVSKEEVDACHCGMCRRWGGGPLLTVMADAPPSFADESALGVYASSDWAERVFCKTCGSSLLWRSADGKMLAVPVALLGDPQGLPFAVEIFVDDKPPYYDFAGERPRMTGAEVVAMFAAEGDS